jgi:hypothetical protein
MQRGNVLSVSGRLVAAALPAMLLFSARAAHADSCTSPDYIESMPPDGATGVPDNAMLFARYASIAQYIDEPVVLEHPAGIDTTVTATFDDTSAILQIVPPMPLVPGDSYTVHWPALRGIDTATLGTSGETTFTAGSEEDTQPPSFSGVTSVSWDVSRTTDNCNGSIDQRYVFDVGIGDAADDGGRDSLTLLVFQTSGPAVDAEAPAPVLVQRIPPPGQRVQVTTTIAQGVGHICFAAIVRDLTLKASTSGAPVCVDTVEPPFFYGCAAAGSPNERVLRTTGNTARHACLALLAWTGVTLVARRTRRRSRGAR